MSKLFYYAIFLLAFSSCTPKAAVFGTETGRFDASFDHYAINVDDVDESVAFYQKVLALEEIYDGTEQAHIRWLSLGNGMSLHCRCNPTDGRTERARFTSKTWTVTGLRLMMPAECGPSRFQSLEVVKSSSFL